MKKLISKIIIIGSLIVPSAMVADYVIDTRGMHASIQFKISHLGYAWIWGRFNDFFR